MFVLFANMFIVSSGPRLSEIVTFGSNDEAIQQRICTVIAFTCWIELYVLRYRTAKVCLTHMDDIFIRVGRVSVNHSHSLD